MPLSPLWQFSVAKSSCPARTPRRRLVRQAPFRAEGDACSIPPAARPRRSPCSVNLYNIPKCQRPGQMRPVIQAAVPTWCRPPGHGCLRTTSGTSPGSPAYATPPVLRPRTGKEASPTYAYLRRVGMGGILRSERIRRQLIGRPVHKPVHKLDFEPVWGLRSGRHFRRKCGFRRRSGRHSVPPVWAGLALLPKMAPEA